MQQFVVRSYLDFQHDHLRISRDCRVHGVPTQQLLDKLNENCNPQVDEFIEMLCLYQDSHQLIVRVHPNKPREYILYQKMDIDYSETFRSSHCSQTKGKAAIETYLEIGDIDKLVPIVAWQVTRHEWLSQNVRIDYLHWAHNGQFGAYSIATFYNPTMDILSLSRPCAAKHIAVLSVFLPTWITGDNLNEKLLENHPVHNGESGPIPAPFYPNNVPMNSNQLGQLLEIEME